MICIRPEQPLDHDRVRELIRRAFGSSDLGHHGEAELVDRLRDNCPDHVSLVAVDDDRVVGHIFFSPVSIEGTDPPLAGMGLAPMAVEPDRQGEGIGSALVRAALEQLSAAGCPYVVVLGHPDYYPRFGFEPASRFRISHGFAGVPQDVFFVKSLNVDSLRSLSQAVAMYRNEFGPQGPPGADL
jgi:predicted N-acetyltransferase YhbS